MAKRVHPKILALASASSVLFLLAPTDAGANPLSQPAFGSASWAKTDAILGGAPSALQSILAQESGASIAHSPLRPASFAKPYVTSAAVRFEVSPGVLSGRPDVFGSVALRVAHTPLDARWRRVEYSPVGGAAAHFAEAQRGKDTAERLKAVNWYVNKRVQFVDDARQFGRADVWSSASETLSRGRGDCEDFAIAKLQMLRRAGLADRDLYLVIVKDLVRRADHAVLVARAAGHMYVLDNGTDQLLDSESISDYRPILTFAENGTWTHGYRMPSAPINVASDESAAKPTLVAAADQRSWSASLLALRTGFNK